MGSERLGTAIENILINDYEPRLKQQIERGTVIFELMQGNKRESKGFKTVMGLQLSYSWGTHTGNRVDVNFPTPQSRIVKQADVFLKRFSISVLIDQALLRSAESGGAFEDELKSLYNTVENTSTKKLAQELYGDGNGALGIVTAPVAPGLNVAVQLDNAQYVYEQMPISFITAAFNPVDNTMGGIVYVTSAIALDVDRVTNIVVFDNIPVPIAAGTFVALGESATINNFVNANGQSEIQGLRAAISKRSTYLGIPRTGANAVSQWRGIVYAEPAAIAPFKFSEAAMKNVDSQIRKNVASTTSDRAGNPYDAILTTMEGHDALYNSRVNQQRFVSTGETIKLAAGYSEVSYKGVPVFADALAPYWNINSALHPYYNYEGYTLDNGTGFATPQRFDFMFFLNKEKWRWFVWDWLHWDKEGGSILYRKQYPNRTQELYADYMGYIEMACEENRTQAMYIFNA